MAASVDEFPIHKFQREFSGDVVEGFDISRIFEADTPSSENRLTLQPQRGQVGDIS